MSTETQTEKTIEEMIAWLRERACDPDYNRLSRPIWLDGVMCFTDGRILVSLTHLPLPAVDADVVCWMGDRWSGTRDGGRIPDLKPILARLTGEPSIDVPEVAGPAENASPRWEVKETHKCNLCEGSGRAECNMGHLHDCDDCEMKGTIEYSVVTGTDGVDIAGFRYQRQLVWIVSQLPGAKFCEPQDDGGIVFVWDMGRGMMMPLRLNSED